jgi:4-aminobutyrate aminotransferase
VTGAPREPPPPGALRPDFRIEGDVNLSQERRDFQERHLGARTRALLEEDARYFLRQSLSTPCLNALSGCEGIYLIDAEGRRIMDFHGNSVHQVGHAHPRVVEAVKRQLDELAFCPRRFSNRTATALAAKLAELAPGDLCKALFAPGGTEAIGIALKLARHATGRFKTLSMWDSFHGASLDAISVGGEALFRRGLGPLLPGALHVPPWAPEGIGRDSADYVDYVLEKEGDVGAVVAEPMRCTTVVCPPPEYWQRVRRSCDRHGALLVFDEIPVALGRTGRMFCFEHFGVEPDVVVLGKGLGGGVFPMAAVVARARLDVAADRALGHYSHEKSPVGAAAALAAIRCIEEEGLLERARELGRRALARLEQLRQRCALIADVRGLGLQLAVELSRDGRKAVEEAERVMYRCMEEGLSFKVSDGNVLTLCPPLVIQPEQLDAALDILERCLKEVAAGAPSGPRAGAAGRRARKT